MFYTLKNGSFTDCSLYGSSMTPPFNPLFIHPQKMVLLEGSFIAEHNILHKIKINRKKTDCFESSLLESSKLSSDVVWLVNLINDKLWLALVESAWWNPCANHHVSHHIPLQPVNRWICGWAALHRRTNTGRLILYGGLFTLVKSHAHHVFLSPRECAEAISIGVYYSTVLLCRL